jgi:hypothetical protein
MTAVPIRVLRDDTVVNRAKPLKTFEGDTVHSVLQTR